MFLNVAQSRMTASDLGIQADDPCLNPSGRLECHLATSVKVRTPRVRNARMGDAKRKKRNVEADGYDLPARPRYD